MLTHHSNRSQRVTRKLAAYTVGLVGVGLAEDAEAEVVYTPATLEAPWFDFRTIRYGEEGRYLGVAANGMLSIDLNQDGANDFDLTAGIGWSASSFTSTICKNTETPSPSTCEFVAQISIGRKFSGHASLHGLRGAAVSQDVYGPAKRFGAGDSIPRGPFAGSEAPLTNQIFSNYFNDTTTSGYFFDRGFVGLQFRDLDNQLHHGWAAIQGVGRRGTTDDIWSVVGFAYESEPDQAIRAGDKGTTLSGDANADGFVDLNDLNLVRNEFGSEFSVGDTDGDFDVDLDDLNAVRDNFGATSAANPVPEPPSLVLLAAGAAGLALLRKRRMK